MGLISVSLGSNGIAHVESCLKQGMGLCAKLLEFSFFDGFAFAPLPQGVNPERAKKFDAGGLVSRRATNMWFVEYLQTLCQHESQGSVVFQDIWAKPDDPAVVNSKVNGFVTNAEVYYFLECSEIDQYAVSRLMGAIQSYLFVAVFVPLPVLSQELLARRRVDDSIIEDIARATLQIFVGAYDQEGIVVWRK
jgi:hypothetical protein